MPLAGQMKPGLPKCQPKWQAWIPLEYKHSSMYVHSTTESTMHFNTWFLGNLGELEQTIGYGQVVELQVDSNESTIFPVVLTVNDLKFEGSLSPVVEVSIKSERRILILSTLESIFKLIGKDPYGRQFNTLHGGTVKWLFDNRIIEQIPMAESQYRSEYLFREHEDILLVRPKEEGQTSLTAIMECTGVATTINLYVIRPIRFEPGIIRIIPGETVRVPLFKGVINGSHKMDIDPGLKVTRENSPEIKWEISGSDAAVWSPNTLSVTGIKKGMVTIMATHSQFPLECNARLTVIVDSLSGDEQAKW
jgi:hypothetical protein